MTLVEYAREIYGPLNSAQIQLLEAYEQAKRENRQIVLVTPRISGRRMLMQIIRTFDKEQDKNEIKQNSDICKRFQ